MTEKQIPRNRNSCHLSCVTLQLLPISSRSKSTHRCQIAKCKILKCYTVATGKCHLVFLRTLGELYDHSALRTWLPFKEAGLRSLASAFLFSLLAFEHCQSILSLYRFLFTFHTTRTDLKHPIMSDIFCLKVHPYCSRNQQFIFLWLNNRPVYAQYGVSRPHFSFDEHLVCFYFLTIMN